MKNKNQQSNITGTIASIQRPNLVQVVAEGGYRHRRIHSVASEIAGITWLGEWNLHGWQHVYYEETNTARLSASKTFCSKIYSELC